MSSLLCRKNTKTYGKTNTFGGIWYARQIFSVILIFLKTNFLGKTEDAIIGHHIPARDIVSHSNCRFGKRRQKICLVDFVIAGFQTPCVRCFAIISLPEVASSSWQLNLQTEPHQNAPGCILSQHPYCLWNPYNHTENRPQSIRHPIYWRIRPDLSSDVSRQSDSYYATINHKIYILTHIPEIIPPNLLHRGHKQISEATATLYDTEVFCSSTIRTCLCLGNAWDLGQVGIVE